MRFVAFVIAALALCPAGAEAGFNVNYLVPGFKGCTGNAGACATEPSSAYTFETAILKSPRGRYSIREGKTTVVVVLKGVRDASGQLVTTIPGNNDDEFVLLLPAGRTVLPTLGTLADDSIPPQRIRIELENGNGKVGYAPVGTQPGLVSISFESPVILDPDGNLFAATGAASKP